MNYPFFGSNPYGGGMSNLGGYNNFGNLGNISNQNNPNPQSSDPNAGFRNVYGIIGGLQSILHIFTSLLDIAYFAKTFKNLFLDLIIHLFKKIYKILKYIVTFKWLLNILKKSNNFHHYLLKNNRYYKLIDGLAKILFLVSLIGLILLKKYKEYQIDTFYEDNTNESNKKNNLIHEEGLIESINKSDTIENLNIGSYSEERWKNYNDLINKK